MKNFLPLTAIILICGLNGNASASDKPIPYHELVDIYEACLAKYVGKFPPDQSYIGKSLCLCQTESFSRGQSYEDLAGLARKPGAFNGAADAYMDNCVIRVQSEIKGEG